MHLTVRHSYREPVTISVTRAAVFAALSVATTLAVPAGASAAADSARSLADRALRASMQQPGCNGVVTSPVGQTTDQAPPPEVLRRYGIFRSPQPTGEPVAPLTYADSGKLASAYQRTRTVAGIRVTVAPLLDWTPPVRPRACDAIVLKKVRALGRRQPHSVQRGALTIVNLRIASDESIRRLPPRTLLLLGTADSGVAVTGALTLSAQRGLFTQAGQTTFVGLIPDGISRIRFRTTGQAEVEVPVADNIAVVRLASDRLFGPGHQTLWLDANGKVVRTIGKRTSRPR